MQHYLQSKGSVVLLHSMAIEMRLNNYQLNKESLGYKRKFSEITGNIFKQIREHVRYYMKDQRNL